MINIGYLDYNENLMMNIEYLDYDEYWISRL